MGDLRKIQQTPTGTFFVCLPRDWALKNGLKKGTLVCLEVASDGKLLVDAEYNAEPPADDYFFECRSLSEARNYRALSSRLRLILT